LKKKNKDKKKVEWEKGGKEIMENRNGIRIKKL
jgi:hypothetical protein